MKERQKIYHIDGIVKGEDGVQRHVVLVGKMVEEDVMNNETANITLVEKKTRKNVNAVAFVQRKVRQKKLTIGLSICHPADDFDIEKGIEIAKSRAKKQPIGSISTTDWNMLQDDMCMGILLVQLAHVSENIDKYLPI